MSWTAILILAGGAYLFKAVGFLVLGPAIDRNATGGEHSGAVPEAEADGGKRCDGGRAAFAARVGQLLPAALLAALVVSQTLVSGAELVIDARLPGVAAGALGVLRGAPFWLVLVIAAVVTATIRLVAS